MSCVCVVQSAAAAATGAIGSSVATPAAEGCFPALGTALVATCSQVSWFLLSPIKPSTKVTLQDCRRTKHQAQQQDSQHVTQPSGLSWPGPSAAAALGMSHSRNSLPMLGMPKELMMAIDGCRYTGAETADVAVGVVAVAACAVTVACCWLLLVAASCGGSCCPTDCRCRKVTCCVPAAVTAEQTQLVLGQC